MSDLSKARLDELLQAASRARLWVVGDVMLDQFVWGRVSRISPEAPVPVVDFDREHLMPGGAANVARNVTALSGRAELAGVVGRDEAGQTLRALLASERIGCRGLVSTARRHTTTKMRIVAGQQQIVRLDRESRGGIDETTTRTLLGRLDRALPGIDGVVVGDYGKGVVTQGLLDGIRERCKRAGCWLSVDPKPVHHLDLRGLSLITPNRKEAFELAGIEDSARAADPMADRPLQEAVQRLQETLRPALLLVTLGELGMLLCRRDQPPFHVPTVAREVFDVSGAGDTVIAAFTLAIAAGASPIEATVFSNHAAGVVVGKRGTATVSPSELAATFAPGPRSA
jgi:D-beta-D-heptose 7-phosphate kinase/D-beta-D-heptose 1-phosphate adenosyltransferase